MNEVLKDLTENPSETACCLRAIATALECPERWVPVSDCGAALNTERYQGHQSPICAICVALGIGVGVRREIGIANTLEIRTYA